MKAVSTPAQRAVAGASSVTLSFQGIDADGEAADPGTVTVTVTGSDGTSIVADAATTGSSTSPRTYSLTDGLTSVDELTAVWNDGTNDIATTTIHVVGGVYLTVEEIRLYEPSLSSYTKPQLIAARQEAENMVEEMCNRAFVHRPAVEWASGNGRRTLPVTWPNVQSVKWGRLYSSGSSYTSLTAAQLAAIKDSRGPNLTFLDGSYWDSGQDNIHVCYVHGHRRPPTDIKRAVAAIIQRQLTAANRSLADNATQYFPAEGGSVMLAQPGMRGAMTGIPWVDEILKRYRYRTVGVY